MTKYKKIKSKKLDGEVVVILEDKSIRRGVSKDGTMAIYSPDEFTLIGGLSKDQLKAVNTIKKVFSGKVIDWKPKKEKK